VSVRRWDSELEAMTGQWFYVVSANNNRDRKSNEVACGSDIIRASIRPAAGRRANDGTPPHSPAHCTGVMGLGRAGRRPSPTFIGRGDASPTPHHFFGLNFVQKLVHCCNRLLTETQLFRFLQVPAGAAGEGRKTASPEIFHH